MLPVLPLNRMLFFQLNLYAQKIIGYERKRGENKIMQNQISWEVAYAYRVVELYED